MKKFNKIAIIDGLNGNILDYAKQEIMGLSLQPFSFPDDYPTSEEETIKRIGEADCVLLSWQTPITNKVLDACPNIKYIGLSATNLANVDVDTIKKRNIILKNVADYGDEATAEYIFAQLLSLVRGFGKHQWKEVPAELNGKTIGIVGLGAVGKQVLRLALGFNMKVLYHQRTRVNDLENDRIVYKSLDELLKECDIVTLHTPKNLKILTQREFELIPNGSILVNTCLGKSFELDEFTAWIKKGQNFAIFDDNPEYQAAVKDLPNVIAPNIAAGRTIESKERLTEKFLTNLLEHLRSDQ